MTIFSKTCIFCFILALIMARTNLYGAEIRPAPSLPVCTISVSFDLKSNLLKGSATITAPPAGAAVSTGALRIVSAILNGSPAGFRAGNTLFKLSGGDRLEITYEVTLSRGGSVPGDIGNPGFVSGGVVSEKGIVLTGAWYPQIGGLAYYNLTARVPTDFTAVSEADEIAARETGSGKEYSFIFSHPLTGIDFVAGRYREFTDSVDGIALYAYFFPEDASLVPDYLEHAKKYFRLYNALLVPYPYKRFSIVENMLPIGESMPTFTLLGQEVVRLPFIPATSLGHEITHQWFGNFVYADFNKGNWLEAITSYLSDHLYREQEGKGWEYRKNILIDFQSYVPPEKDFPLRKFQERTDSASMAIGYGKGAMLFHMLEKLVGKETFDGSVRRLIRNNEFREASWADVEKAFEQESGMDFAWFFTQWLDRTGVPAFVVRHPGARVLNGLPYAAFELIQQNEPYRVALPATVAMEKRESTEVLSMQTATQYFRLLAAETPSSFILDGDYDVMRSLAPDEFPPVIARLLGDKNKMIVYPEQEKEKYSGLISLLRERGFAVKEQGAVTDKDIETSSLLVAGSESPVWKRLFGTPAERRHGFFLAVRENPLNRAHVAASVSADSKEEADLAAPKIIHYGTYSVLAFKKGELAAKETAKTDRGITFDLREPIRAVRPDRTATTAEVVDAVGNDALILIGERHTNYEDHKAELAVIMGLHQKGRKFAVGMEMFQAPFQNAVDEYLAGTIDEREFLKKTEYFKRWGFDYNLYREIIEFARAKGVPIVALNQRTEIMDKVAAGGLDALSPEERKEIPGDMNMADESYKKRLKDVYEDHPAGTTFENFYQSQILWDETMAHSAARYMQERPEYQMVVLAGVEHIMYGSGIPSRIERLSGRKYVTLVNGMFDRDAGTYVLFPEPLEPPFTPKLGVILRETGAELRVDDFSADSPARRAGIEKGDVIRSVNGWKTGSVSDVKIALFDKEPGQSVGVKVIRKSLFFGSKELEIQVSL